MFAKSEASCSSNGAGKKASNGQLAIFTFNSSSFREKRVGLKLEILSVRGKQLPVRKKHFKSLEHNDRKVTAQEVELA